MTAAHIIDEWEIVDTIDVDHLDDRPDELEQVAVEEGPDGDLRAVPFSDPDYPPGYVEIDVDLMEYDKVCRCVQMATDDDRRIDFTQVPTWPADGPTATEPDWW